MNHIFAARLTDLRSKAGLSQKELAVTLKVTAATLSNYENGIYLPPLEKACTLAKEFDCSLDYLTGLSNIDLDPTLFSKSVTENLTFYQIIKLLFSMEKKDLLEIVRYAEFLKYKRKRSQYTEGPKGYLVAEDAKDNIPFKE